MEGELSWLVYPVETIVAEKLQTLIERAGANSRAKDVYDLHYYLPLVNPDVLTKAIARCFEFRGTPIPSDPADYLSKIDLALIKQGWKSATASLKNPPHFDEAFNVVIKELQRLFADPRKRK